MSAFRQFKWTRIACYMGYITQAIANNFMPLLFLTFEKSFGISLTQISLLIVLNCGTQLVTDLVAAKLIDRLNLRAVAVGAQMLAVLGLCGMGLLPFLLPNPYLGLMIATLLCAVGGGMDEVIVSPLMEACPNEDKEASMSLLHSFYCWGQAGIVLLSVGFFALFGIENWPALAAVIALIPLCGGLLFAVVPIIRLPGAEGGTKLRSLFANGLFLWLLAMILAGGAAEMVMSQWASSFAEAGLKVSKTVGDLLGPCMFAVLMGLSRVIYARIADKVDLLPVIAASAVLCIISYLLAALVPNAIVSLIGCALCGFSVGIFWPGVYSLSAKKLPEGGVPMFAILAIAGDLGCLSAPSIAGWVADRRGGDMRLSFLLATAAPILILACAFVVRLYTKRTKKDGNVR